MSTETEEQRVPVLEIETFRLAAGADEAAFLAADRRVQVEFAYQRPGLLRRTTARGDDGDWAVVVLWDSVEDADAARRAGADDPAVAELRALVEGGSDVRRYRTLD